MDNADGLGPSTAPLALQDFFVKMRQPSAADAVRAIKSFLVSFSNNVPDPERDGAAIQEFFSNMEAAFRAHPLWFGCSEEELERAGEGLEKYVMTKLFTRLFAPLPDERKLDEQLSEKMALFQQFVRPENLDIKPTFQNEESWLLAQKELQKINMYKAPRDKLVCILNCCKVINNLLFQASIASDEHLPGADEFLPVLIYVTIKADPPQLHSNLLYIQRYRSQSRLVAEAAYFFTNMLSAESFIMNIDANALSMDASEFENNMESARLVLSGLTANPIGVSSQSDQILGHLAGLEIMEPTGQSLSSKKESQPSIQPQLSEIKSENKETRIRSLSDLENSGATLLLKENHAIRVFHEYPYLFASVGDLTVEDVDELLNNYKQLVFKYVCLVKGLSATTPYISAAGKGKDVRVDLKKEKQEDDFKECEDVRGVEVNNEKQNDCEKEDEMVLPPGWENNSNPE